MPSESPSSPQNLSDDISIVTAFFDIGRSEWTEEKGFPHYLHRTTDTYIERFGTMAALENEMVIYTSPDLAPRVAALRKGKEHKTVIVPMHLHETFPGKFEEIAKIQNDPAFKARIHPQQRINPEYSSPDYVLVTNMKAVFAAHAVQNKLVHNRQVAWMDFGYCRDKEAAGGGAVWQYAFTPGKVHLFVFGFYPPEMPMEEVTANNHVFVAGACVVAERDLWPTFAQLTRKAADHLQQCGLVDDDQTLFLMASIAKPDLFELHKIPSSDWQPVLKTFNKNAVGSRG